ncbi:MAG: hypothetical protein GXP35_04715 [Actinobacteria bacterium]|nr:hypothetical protein [Actinomycetota bacterium]
MLPNSALAALTPTQVTIVVLVGLVLVAIALWVLFSWRPRHRATQAETAAQMFREDHLGEWAHKRLSTWTTDERHAALRYYTRVGFQARSGAIRTDTVPDNHHATIVALAAQETAGGTAKTKWGEVEWLGRNLAKRRDDLSIKWTPTAKASPDTMVDDKAPTAAEAELGDSGAGKTDGESNALTLAAAPNLASDEGDATIEGVSTLGQDAAETEVADIQLRSFDDADDTEFDSTSELEATDDLGAAAGPDSAKDSAVVVETSGADAIDAAAHAVNTDEAASQDVADTDGADAPDEPVDSAATARAVSLADALARAEVVPDIAAPSTSLGTPLSSVDSENEELAETIDAVSNADSTAETPDTSETQVPETPDPEIEADISDSTPFEATAGQSSDHDQTTGRANVPTWILDARAALDSLDADATSASAEPEAVPSDAGETNGNEQTFEVATLTTPVELDADELDGDELDGDELVLADLDDVEVAYLAASTASAATAADAELRIRMQRLRRRAKRQMRKSADDQAIAVRRAEQGRKKKAREYTKRAAAHEAKATKFKARRRKLRDIRQGTYTE